MVYAGLALCCVGLLAFGLYLQHVVGLEPCPMCIVQRYAMVCIAVLSAFAWFISRKSMQVAMSLLLLIASSFGAFVAARQSYLQWYPPELVSCGRDFYGMVESFPLKRAIPMIFKGSGDCTKVDWTFLGGSIANWSYVAFVVFALVGLTIAVQAWRSR